MNRFLCISTIFLFLISKELKAQTTLQYTPLRCVGNIPTDFLSLSHEKTSNEIERIEQQNISRKERKLEKKFALNSNFGIDAILLSGKVLYGDPLSIYVNKVADKILEKDASLRKELRFYVLKSTSVNAFSSNQGIIFVTVGLLAKVQDEAGLAFILCHEISHYVKKHPLKQYKISDKIKSGTGQYRNLDFDQKISQIYKYSRDSELEADKAGLELFLQTQYATSSVIDAFEMLRISHLPYHDFKWNSKLLEDDIFKIKKLTLNEFDKNNALEPEEESDEEEDDEEEQENSTHPDIDKRIRLLEKFIDAAKTKGTENYLNGKSEFEIISQQARIEYFFILINNARFIEAYYLAYAFESIYDEHQFTSKIKAYCINSIKTKKESSTHTVSLKKGSHTDFNLNKYFEKLSKEELSVLKVRFAWDAYIANKDSFSNALFNHSMRQLFLKTGYRRSTFKDQTTTDSIFLIMKRDSSIGDKKSNPEWAFYHMLNDAYFKNTLKTYSEIEDDDEDEELSYDERWSIRSKRRKYGYTAGVDSMILINPSYIKLVVGKKIKRDLIFDEKTELDLSQNFIEMAEANKIHLHSINLMDKKQLTTEILNDYSQFMEWMTEKINKIEQEDMILFNRQFTDSLVKKTNTEKVCLSFINNIIYKDEFQVGQLVYSMIITPILPFYLYKQLHRRQDVILTTAIFDLNKGSIEYFYNSNLQFKFRKKDFLNAQLYALFHQIKTTVR